MLTKIEYFTKDKHYTGMINFLDDSIPWDFFHRENGPAYIEYYDTNDIFIEQYYKNGELHREDGPAYVEYYRSGKVKDVDYWLNYRNMGRTLWEFLVKHEIHGNPLYWTLDQLFIIEAFTNQN